MTDQTGETTQDDDTAVYADATAVTRDGEPMIVCEGVHKYFGRLEVLKGIAAERPVQIAVHDCPQNGGKAEAVRQGMLRALEEGADYEYPHRCWSCMVPCLIREDTVMDEVDGQVRTYCSETCHWTDKVAFPPLALVSISV